MPEHLARGEVLFLFAESEPGSATASYAALSLLPADVARPLRVQPAVQASDRQLPSLERVQWEYVRAVLACCNGNISEAARELGIHRQSLQRMLKRHQPRR